MKPDTEQMGLFETQAARSLLDQLLQDSRLYRQSNDCKALLDFVIRLRNFAPFNAMLLQVQKPGLRFAASARDWRERFGRTPKEAARPLLILWPFGPVALVYDVIDTEGKVLPQDVASFFAQGSIDEAKFGSFCTMMTKKFIELSLVDAGDGKAGSIRCIKPATKDEEASRYRMHINRNHTVPVQVVTLAHELGHLFLGHLGPDKYLKIPDRGGRIIVESVAGWPWTGWPNARGLGGRMAVEYALSAVRSVRLKLNPSLSWSARETASSLSPRPT